MIEVLLGIAQVAGAVSAVGILAWVFLHDQVRSTLGKTPRTAIRDVQAGATVKIAGRVRYLGEPLVAPLSGRTCTHYVVVIKQRVDHGKSSSWRTIVHEEKTQDFLVQDESGAARVDTRSVFVSFEQDHHVKTGLMTDATPALQAVLARHNIAPTGLLFNKTLRCTEAILAADETAVVAGLASLEAVTDGSPAAVETYRGASRPVIAAPAGQTQRVLISDDDALAGAVATPER